MSAPQKCKLTWHQSDRNIHKLKNHLYNSDISDADYEFSNDNTGIPEVDGSDDNGSHTEQINLVPLEMAIFKYFMETNC